MSIIKWFKAYITYKAVMAQVLKDLGWQSEFWTFEPYHWVAAVGHTVAVPKAWTWKGRVGHWACPLLKQQNLLHLHLADTPGIVINVKNSGIMTTLLIFVFCSVYSSSLTTLSCRIRKPITSVKHFVQGGNTAWMGCRSITVHHPHTFTHSFTPMR